MPPLNLRSRLTPLPMMLLALFALPGCFHNDDDPAPAPAPVVDVNPTGYYSGPNGPTSVSDGAGGTIMLDDLQAMVSGNRIMMMSMANELLYDGTITDITENDFTADFTIYTAGENPVDATVTGTITEGASITGTLTGSGAGSGTFSLLYANTNNQVAAMASAWLGPGGGFFEIGFTIDGAGHLIHDESAGVNPFLQCEMNGTVTPVSGTRLYSVDVELTDCNDLAVNGAGYTGLTTTRDGTAANNLLVYSVSNGAYTVSGEFNPD